MINPKDARSFDSAGVVIKYLDTDDQQPQKDVVLLLHGLIASSKTWGDKLVPAIVKAGFRVLAVDLRGHGLSGKPYGANDYGTHLVEDIVRLLDHAGVKSCHILGYSMGSFIGLRMAVEHACVDARRRPSW